MVVVVVRRGIVTEDREIVVARGHAKRLLGLGLGNVSFGNDDGDGNGDGNRRKEKTTLSWKGCGSFGLGMESYLRN